MFIPSTGQDVRKGHARVRRPLLQSRAVQLGGALVVAVLLPWLVRHAIGFSAGDMALIRNTVAANVAAVIVGYYFYRSLTFHPGVQAAYFVLPTFTVAYAFILFILVFTRLDYNRVLLAVGYFACLTWFYGMMLLPQRRGPLSVGVVPFGEIKQLGEIRQIEWQQLAEPWPDNLGRYDLVVADFRSDIPPEWERFLTDATLAGTTVLDVKQLRESLTGRTQIDHLSENAFGSLFPARGYLKLKMVLDFFSALGALVVLAPLLVLVGIAVRLDSDGPALFRQKRVGYRGKVFTVYKFRTMHATERDTADRSAAMTGDADPRITRLGRFLRRTRIDELPQMVNILRGEMSWIGPRPEARVLSEWYEQELPFYRYRHVVRPGITGWAQVNQGHVAEIEDVLGKLQFDFYYIRHFSPWLDGLVVVRTFLTVMSGVGAR